MPSPSVPPPGYSETTQLYDLDQRVALLQKRRPALRRPIVVGEIVGSAFDPKMRN